MKTILIAILVINSSCAFSMGGKGLPPIMDRPIEIWNGVSEEAAICSLQTTHEPTFSEVQALLKGDLNAESEVCIPAYDPRFNKFSALTFDDLGVLMKYIETLKNKCERWKK